MNLVPKTNSYHQRFKPIEERFWEKVDKSSRRTNYEIFNRRARNPRANGRHRATGERAGLAALELADAFNFRTENNLVDAGSRPLSPVLDALQIDRKLEQ